MPQETARSRRQKTETQQSIRRKLAVGGKLSSRRDSVYHYDAEARIFEKAATFEARQMVKESEALYSTIAEDVSAEPEKETISVLLVEPGKFPQPIEMGTKLSDIQEKVGGLIETSYPFADKACLVMSDTGKLEGLPLNRALRDEHGEIYDIVAGSFLVVGINGDSFSSLSTYQMKLYEEKFHSPEVFLRMGKSFMAIPLSDEAVKLQEEREHEKAAEKTVGKADVKKDTPKKNHRREPR